MKNYRFYFNARAYVDIEADSEEEARETLEGDDSPEPTVEVEPYPSFVVDESEE